ncbi:MAG TPA: thioredoxin family protein [Bacteroidota bacterium]|nr:thioredoxin family protein [Bacteroidota bacterium]
MPGQQLRIGNPLPRFSGLRGVDGKTHSGSDFHESVIVVVFSCNHCPYVQAYEDRMMDFQKTYSAKGVRLVAINANDEMNYPEDSYDEMVKRAKKRNFNFPYLCDTDQSVADAFGATHTPQFFVFDKERKLRYTGKLDDNWKVAADAKEHYLRDAVDAILAGKPVKVPETHSIGCTIKWAT